VLAVTGAGLLSAIIAAPDLIDLVRYRAFGSVPPVALTVRAFPFTDVLFPDGIARYAARLAALPVNYLIELGVLLAGAWLYWRRRPWEREFGGETGRLLVLSALAGLVIATFLRSTIINNDLGWRVVLFAQLAALLWTSAALSSASMQAALPRGASPAARAVLVMGLLGCLGVAYDLMALRAYQPLGLIGEEGLRRDPVIDREVRTAYAWLAANADRRLVVQHNPDAKRAFGYGLYGRSRVAVSDRDNARLFGASQAEIASRLADIIPAFATPMAANEALRTFARNRIDIVLVTASDRAWHDEASWVWALPSLFATRHVRVLSVCPDPGAVVAGRS
jgi:hypothetical protein